VNADGQRPVLRFVPVRDWRALEDELDAQALTDSQEHGFERLVAREVQAMRERSAALPPLPAWDGKKNSQLRMP